jgi:hypothetical protein
VDNGSQTEAVRQRSASKKLTETLSNTTRTPKSGRPLSTNALTTTRPVTGSLTSMRCSRYPLKVCPPWATTTKSSQKKVRTGPCSERAAGLRFSCQTHLVHEATVLAVLGKFAQRTQLSHGRGVVDGEASENPVIVLL